MINIFGVIYGKIYDIVVNPSNDKSYEAQAEFDEGWNNEMRDLDAEREMEKKYLSMNTEKENSLYRPYFEKLKGKKKDYLEWISNNYPSNIETLKKMPHYPKEVIDKMNLEYFVAQEILLDPTRQI